ncbi:MAG: DUF4091 domain-containing protein [Desulfobacter sp.]|nr:MAG: DUF4091 domain-containing protein [Desulfobacter sp.]
MTKNHQIKQIYSLQKKSVMNLWLIFFVLFSLLIDIEPLLAGFVLPNSNQSKLKLKVPIVRDVSISSVGKEQYRSNGGSEKLKLKGIQESVLFDLDVTCLKGTLVQNAWLWFKSASPYDAPMRKSGISSISSEWQEGGSWGGKGGPCFAQAEYGKKDWSYPGSTLMDVVFGRGNTIWQSNEPSGPDKEGWQRLRIGPDIIAARIAGVSKGFCLYDDVGNEWEEKDGQFQYRYFPNRLIYSRECGDKGPWVEIEIKGKDHIHPESIEDIRTKTEGLHSGEAFLFWKTPRDSGGGRVLGFDVFWKDGRSRNAFPRYLIPMAEDADKEVMMHIRDMGFSPGKEIEIHVVSVDSAGNRSRAFKRKVVLSEGFGGLKVRRPEIKAFPGSESSLSLDSIKVSVVDLLDKYVPETNRFIPDRDRKYWGGNHLFSEADRIARLHGAGNEDVCFQVLVRGKSDDLSLEFFFDNNPDIVTSIYKAECVRVERSWLGSEMIPDPLVPVQNGDRMSLDGGKSFVCEIYIPPDLSPGIKKGRLSIKSGNSKIEMDVQLRVWNFNLPDRLSFIPEMNAYAKVSPFKGYQYYRLAHRHRTCLNRLPYGWNGLPEFAPKKGEQGFQWEEWDKYVGPLLDGSAFKDLPRKGEPLDVFYLPFSENWPVKISDHYTKSWWADQALSGNYRQSLKKAFQDFALHLKEKQWDRTQFQFYLNNKVYYRKKFRGSSAPWIFDEPVNIQDFKALEWYGGLWHEAVDPLKGGTDAVFRCDISYSQYGRDILWDVTDIEYIGGNTLQKTRMKRDELVLNPDKQFAEYGTANKLEDPNLQSVLWQLSAWSKGACGVLPWQTIGSDKCWEQGEQTALFYPKGEYVFPSIRLKAFRYGQQLVEYLEILGEVLGIPDDAVRHWVAGQLGWTEDLRKISIQGAGTLVVDGITITDLWKFRLSVGMTIHEVLKKRGSAGS